MKTYPHEPISAISNESGIPTSIENLSYYNDKTREGIAIGLTKREYFAGLAMQGSMASITETFGGDAVNTAKRAVEYADALIQELNNSAQ